MAKSKGQKAILTEWSFLPFAPCFLPFYKLPEGFFVPHTHFSPVYYIVK